MIVVAFPGVQALDVTGPAEVFAIANRWLPGDRRYLLTVAANRVVDLACEAVGGSSYRRGTELERLSRAAGIHAIVPKDKAATHLIRQAEVLVALAA